MTEIEKMILQALLTIIGGALLYVLTKAFYLYLIKPYYDFKREVIETKIDLLFHLNILTNAFKQETINENDIGKILTCQENIRSRWSKFFVKYESVPKWIFLPILPTSKEMKNIQDNLIYLSNRKIINGTSSDCVESNEKIKEILKIFKKTI